MLQPGTIIANDFRIVRPLSEGGMGSVFVADQLSTGAQRALKIVRRELLHDPRLRQRFEQEARVTANIASDHVVSVVAAGIDQQTQLPWLAMELLKGQTLFDMVQQRGSLSPGDSVELFTQLCHAIAAAHAVNVVHRDLKPENIFLAESRRVGMPFFVKVLDFGIARVMAEVKISSTEAMGTPLWMAPEQSNKGTNIGPWTDLWPLGLMAFFSLTGQHYWLSASRDDSTMGVLREILIEPIMPASQRAAQLGVANRLPPGFDPWFAQLVERDPQRRMANVSAARDGLLAILRGGGAAASAATVLPQGAMPMGPAHSPANSPAAMAPTSYPNPSLPRMSQPGTPPPGTPYGTPPQPPYGPPPGTPYGTPPHASPYGPPPQGAAPAPQQGSGTMMASPAWSPYGGTQQGGATPPPTAATGPRKSGGGGGMGLWLGLGAGLLAIAGVVGIFAFKSYQSGKNAKDCNDESQAADHRIEACRATCSAKPGDDSCRLKGELLVASGQASNVTEGLDALKTACTAGSAKACRRAGTASLFPPKGGPARDVKGGASLLEKACTLSASECAGEGVSVEYGYTASSMSAGDLYDRACTGGDPIACVYGGVYGKRHPLAAKGSSASGGSSSSTLLRSRCGTKDSEACAALGVSVEDTAKAEAQTSYKTACDAGDALACVNLGKLELDDASASDARDLFKKACDGGEAAGCNNLGALATGQPIVDRMGPRGAHSYKLFCGGALSAGCAGWGDAKTPVGVKVDLADAVAQFDKACDMGLLMACVNEGALILVGQGGPRDRARAQGFFQRACDGGDPGGCGESATLSLQDRVGAPKDDKKGFGLMKEACDGGETDACANVAVLRLLDRGDGGAKSDALAKLKGYCDTKGLWCDSLGDLYASGTGGVAKDEAEARRLYEKSCANGTGHTGTCSVYADALKNGFGGPKDGTKAKELLNKACDHNDFEACTGLGFWYEDGDVVAKDASKAMSLYQKGCDMGHAMSCNALSNLYANGIGVPRDPVKASGLAREACEGAYSAGCGSYGIMLARGVGNPRDPANAKPYLDQACRTGVKIACDELTSLGFARP
ncbi:hypothetical protein BH09MYX1_BH09MYX1_55200 [soil metagenome]